MTRQAALTIKEDGPRAVVKAELSDDGRGLYKAWLTGPTGRFLLGTLAPEGGLLTVRRTLTLAELRRSGAWPPEHCEAELSFAFPGADLPLGWQTASDPGALFQDRDLARAARDLSGALVRRDPGGFYLAAPFDAGRGFPLVPAFCFAVVRELGSRLYAIFCFDEKSWPCFPNNGSGQGPY